MLKTAGEAPRLPAPKPIDVSLLSLALPVSWLVAEIEVTDPFPARTSYLLRHQGSC